MKKVKKVHTPPPPESLLGSNYVTLAEIATSQYSLLTQFLVRSEKKGETWEEISEYFSQSYIIGSLISFPGREKCPLSAPDRKWEQDINLCFRMLVRCNKDPPWADHEWNRVVWKEESFQDESKRHPASNSPQNNKIRPRRWDEKKPSKDAHTLRKNEEKRRRDDPGTGWRVGYYVLAHRDIPRPLSGLRIRVRL